MGKKNFKYIILMTDFGNDSYVGVMKGVIKSINPKVEIIDLTHNIEPQNVLQSAYVLAGSYKYFPKGSIFVCVIDPGVGSERNIIIVETQKYKFIVPNNGIISKVIEKEKILNVYEVAPLNDTNKKYFLFPISYTFHGRDIFAPISAYLSKGKQLKDILKKIELSCVYKLNLPKVKIKNKCFIGQYIFYDHFGNIVTNLEESLLKKNIKYKVISEFGKCKITIPVVKSYSEVNINNLLAIPNSYGYIEISIRNGSAKKFFEEKKYDIKNMKFILSE